MTDEEAASEVRACRSPGIEDTGFRAFLGLSWESRALGIRFRV